MTTETILAVFEDFNERRAGSLPAPAENELTDPVELSRISEEAWTDGYLTGRHDHSKPGDDRTLTARLLTSVHELDAKVAEAVEVASLAVADLMVNTVVAVTSDSWSSRLMERVQAVTERIKPALAVAPIFELRDDTGSLYLYENISDLSRALENGSGEDVTIRWQRGEATISRTALYDDLCAAIIPLSSDIRHRSARRTVQSGHNAEPRPNMRLSP